VTARAIVVLVTGDPVPCVLDRRGGYASLIRASAPSFANHPWVELDVRKLDVLPRLTDSLGVIVTGSASSVMELEPWMERTATRLRELTRDGVPVLGICFGHQLLGHAMGGRVARNPRGREMGTVELVLSRTDPVLGEAGVWVVNSTHLDSVVELPSGAELLGATGLEKHAAVRFSESTWGVQFHPELDAAAMRDYFNTRRTLLEDERFDVVRAEQGVRDAPFGAGVIERFLAHAAGGERPARVGTDASSRSPGADERSGAGGCALGDLQPAGRAGR
jgi:GMP synthase (glutamine-hydrolysing)